MSTPTIPPRPARASNTPASSGASHMEVPKIPPRPAKRSVDRSISPNRESFARSPLNDPAFLHNQNHHKDSQLSHELPPRPPSVTLPSIGQEGSEYASLEDLSRSNTHEDRANSPHQTKNIAGDLPLFAPKASVPSSTAKSRIQTVTRTDSSQAAAVGIGKLAPDDKYPAGLDSGRSDSSAGVRTRPGSVYKDSEEKQAQGIPEIGIQVPMYPHAGDVQAPTPSPYEQQHSPTAVGFSNKGSHPTGRHHGRTKSGREIFHGPPGSYGLHGHGVIPKDNFQQEWYAKHPEEMAREKAGEYGPHIQVNRKDYHWVGDDLQKLVHSSATKGIGMGTSREAIGTPDEQIGYLASEEFASRMASPKPSSARPSSVHGANVESHLRDQTTPEDKLAGTKTPESEGDDQHHVIHIDPPTHHSNKHVGKEFELPVEEFAGGNASEDGGWVSGYGHPILASDEIKKHPESEWRQPAVTPELDRRENDEFSLDDVGMAQRSRPHSRSSSRTNMKVSRFASPNEHNDRSGTPLESTKEYEPLFPEDEEDQAEWKPKTAADKLKRPDLARHHFPSQDVWEDTPSSLQLQTTVETPQAPEEPPYEEVNPGDADIGTVFEKPEAEQARKEQEPPAEEQTSFLPEHAHRFANKHLNKDHLTGPSRPGMQQRFPSHDIWEDAPEHGQLVTEVSAPQTEHTDEYADESTTTEKPSIPARPVLPARPAKEASPTDKKAPLLPERPKPSIPARPTKPLTKSSEKVPTLDSQSTEPPQPKPKPQIPARPAGSKIAALQAGFLKDLNSKLGLGPQAPKVKEPEVEKEEEPAKPLADARKGRAKGPQRRKPAGSSSSSSPAPAVATITAEVAVPRPKLTLAGVSTVWSIGDDGAVDVPAAALAKALHEKLPAVKKSEEVVQPTEPDVLSPGEKAETLYLDAAKEVQAEESAVYEAKHEAEEAELTKTSTNLSSKSAEQSAEQQEDVKVDTSEVEVPGAFPEESSQEVREKDVAVEKSAEELAPQPELPKLEPRTYTPAVSEPVDSAKFEEGKDAEAREVGL